MDVLRRNVVFKRAQRGLSQVELAKRASVARQTISKVESGEGDVTVGVLEKLARVLRCEVRELFECRSAAADDIELERRAKAAASDFVNADRLLDAIDEANEIRYSHAGRPKAVGRRTASRRR
ncbi:MAG TPA: helix-turn-helix domain-containing protein [Candidatus Baltobacteraceae bacterium]